MTYLPPDGVWTREEREEAAQSYEVVWGGPCATERAVATVDALVRALEDGIKVAPSVLSPSGKRVAGDWAKAARALLAALVE